MTYAIVKGIVLSGGEPNWSTPVSTVGRVTFPTTLAAGNAFFLTTTNAATSVALSNGQSMMLDYVDAVNATSFWSLASVTGSPTYADVTTATAYAASYASYEEISGLAGVFSFAGATAIASDSGQFGTAYSVPFTTTASQSFVRVTLPSDTGGNPMTIDTAGYTQDATSYGGVMSFVSSAALTPGAKTVNLTYTSGARYKANVVEYSLAAAGPTVSTVSSNSNAEGSAIVHTVTLSAATTASTNFAASLAGVTATLGTDLISSLSFATFSAGVTFSTGNLVVPSGVTSFTVTIPTTDDALNEASETYTLTVGGVSGTGTITDNDAVPTISVTDPTQSGATVTFSVNLSAASGRTVSVDYATANSTAIAGTDYTAASGTLTFAPGETSKTVAVTVL